MKRRSGDPRAGDLRRAVGDGAVAVGSGGRGAKELCERRVPVPSSALRRLEGGLPEERVTKAVHTFVEPEGAAKNVKTIEKWLEANPNELTVELFDKAGLRHSFPPEPADALRSVLGVP